MLRVRRLVEDDFDRHALDDFDVVPRCIFGWNQTELCSSTCLEAVDMSFEHLIRVGVYGDVHRLARRHSSNLALFEVGSDPNVSGYDRQKRLPNLNLGAFFDRLACHTAGFGSVDLRIGELEFCLFYLGPQLFNSCAGRLSLSLTNCHLPRRSFGLGQTTEGFTDTSLRAHYLRFCLARSLRCRSLSRASLVQLCGRSGNLLPGSIELRAGRACGCNGLIQLLFRNLILAKQ